jgi:carbonic anhydrase/acetyltransferase-like protein (isoleucine patch superfamily)
MSLRQFEGFTPSIHPTSFVDSTALIIGNVSARLFLLADGGDTWRYP